MRNAFYILPAVLTKAFGEFFYRTQLNMCDKDTFYTRIRAQEESQPQVSIELRSL